MERICPMGESSPRRLSAAKSVGQEAAAQFEHAPDFSESLSLEVVG